LRALRDYQILDTAPEETFNDLTRLAAYICATPVALISLIDTNRQWHKARVGTEMFEAPRDVSFCAHAILYDGPLLVRDATADKRFAANPMVVSEPHIRFYAGSPLITQDGLKLGTLCVLDREPRVLSQEQVAALRMLGQQVMAQLELRREVRTLARSVSRHKHNVEELERQLREKR
jgi:two-component system NtrC family sensor kinase